jgi:hypothetical protein
VKMFPKSGIWNLSFLWSCGSAVFERYANELHTLRRSCVACAT